MPVIEVDRLHKRYGERTAVHDVSFEVGEGEIFGILGPNGAGKTTTVECIEGLRSPDGGTISVHGLDPQRDRDRLRKVLGIQLQAGELPDKLRVGEAVQLFASFYPAPADGRELVDRWGLGAAWRTSYRALSGGQKQRLSIVLSLIGNPRVAILDELTTGLDPQGRRDTWAAIEQIRDSGVTVVLVTHFMEEAERLCDRLAVIDAGRVVAVDTPAGLVHDMGGGQRLRFRSSVRFEDDLLTALPEVNALRRTGPTVEVTGSGELLHAVTAVLALHEVVVVDLRMDRPGLEDAFVALTGHAVEA